MPFALKSIYPWGFTGFYVWRHSYIETRRKSSQDRKKMTTRSFTTWQKMKSLTKYFSCDSKAWLIRSEFYREFLKCVADPRVDGTWHDFVATINNPVESCFIARFWSAPWLAWYLAQGSLTIDYAQKNHPNYLWYLVVRQYKKLAKKGTF